MIERAERRANHLSGARLDHVQREVESLATGPPPAGVGVREGIVEPLMRRARRARNVTALTIIAPLASLDSAELKVLFGADPHPLKGFPPSHFARVALMPQVMMDVGQPFPDVLPVPYLVMSCDIDGDLDSYVEAITATRAPAPPSTRCSTCASAIRGPIGRERCGTGSSATAGSRAIPSRATSRARPPRSEMIEVRQRIAERLDVGL